MPEIICELCGKHKHITPSYTRQNKTGIYFCSKECARVYRKCLAVKKNGNIAAVSR